jgi:hypothetical protein
MPNTEGKRLDELRHRDQRGEELSPAERTELRLLREWKKLIVKKRTRIEDRELDRELREAHDA